MSKGSAPSAPDPYTTAAAQYQYGTEAGAYTTALNDVNTTGPTGTTSYNVTGTDPVTGAPIRTETTSLSPTEQNIFNQSQGIQTGQLGTAQNFLGQVNQASGSGEPTIQPVQYSATGGPIQSSINTSGVPGIENTQDAYTTGQSTALAGEMAALQPGLDQQREQLDSSLRNSGNLPGSPAYDNAMDALDQDQASQKTQAAGQAISAGNTLQNTQYGESANTNQQLFGQAATEQTQNNAAESQLFGQNTSNATLNNTAGSTALADYAQKVGIPLNELQAILGGSQVSAPQANAAGTANVQAPDLESAFNTQYQGALAGYNANVASSNADVTAGAGLTSALIMALGSSF